MVCSPPTKAEIERLEGDRRALRELVHENTGMRTARRFWIVDRAMQARIAELAAS